MTARPNVMIIAAPRDVNPSLLTLFRTSGMAVSTVADAQEACRQGNGHPPNLILYDTEVPPPGGLASFQALREAFDAGLIVLCPNADSLACILALEMGADDVVGRGRDPRITQPDVWTFGLGRAVPVFP